MLPTVLFHEYKLCYLDSSKKPGNFSKFETNFTALDTNMTFARGNKNSMCLAVNIQAKLLIVFSSIVLVLMIAEKLLKNKEGINRDIVTVMKMIANVETVMASVLCLYSILELKLGVCETFPANPHGYFISVFMACMQWFVTCLLLTRNWIIAINCYLRSKMFSTNVSSQNMLSFKVKCFLVLVFITSATLSFLRSLSHKGYICLDSPEKMILMLPWNQFKGFIRVFESFVYFPFQALLPIFICSYTTVKVVILLCKASMNRTSMQFTHGGSNYIIKPVVILLIINFSFIIAELPVVFYRLLAFLGVQFKSNSLVWLPNVLMVIDSLLNCLVYIVTMKTVCCNFCFNVACLGHSTLGVQSVPGRRHTIQGGSITTMTTTDQARSVAVRIASLNSSCDGKNNSDTFVLSRGKYDSVSVSEESNKKLEIKVTEL